MTAFPPHLTTWRKSSASGTGNCVETAVVDRSVLVRDSKAGPDGPVLRFTFAEWDAFLHGVRGGEFDLDGHSPYSAVPVSATG